MVIPHGVIRYMVCPDVNDLGIPDLSRVSEIFRPFYGTGAETSLRVKFPP